MKLGVVMDSIATIHYHKDSTFAMLLEAKVRGYELFYFELQDLFQLHDQACGHAQKLEVFADEHRWFKLTPAPTMPLSELDIILMRKDPPFNEAYIYATYILEQAEKAGSLVVNRPQSLRDANEKLYATHFPECIPPSIVTANRKDLIHFWQEHKDIVCKPLNTMGGKFVFRLQAGDVNSNVIFDTLLGQESKFIMAQKFIPEITAGDKRILLIDGEAIPYCLVRVPQKGDWRGNLAVGAKGEVQTLNQRDYEICAQIGPNLRARGLYFAGIDVIGNYLTEINVTSPTGIREIDAGASLNVSATLFDILESKI